MESKNIYVVYHRVIISVIMKKYLDTLFNVISVHVCHFTFSQNISFGFVHTNTTVCTAVIDFTTAEKNVLMKNAPGYYKRNL